MKLVHDVQVDKNTIITATLTVDRGWLRMDHNSSGKYVGGTNLRVDHIVRVEKNPATPSADHFWITLTDRDATKTVIPFGMTADEVTQLDEALGS